MIGTTVRVHVNLHRGDFTITDPKTRKRIGSADDITLTGVTFKVSEARRQAVIRQGQREVHAWAIGTVVAINTAPDVDALRAVTYNPHRAPLFHFADGSGDVTAADRVTFRHRRCYV